MSKAKISLNKLGEYLTANSSRRKRIVYDAKNPKGFIVTRYKSAREAIKEYIISQYDENLMIDRINILEKKDVDSDFQENDRDTSIEALDHILDSTFPDLSGFHIEDSNGGNPKVTISDVEVSVNPDLIIRGTYRGKKVIGAIKIHLSKGNILNEEGSKNVSTMIRSFVQDHIAEDDEIVEPKLCLSIDAFGKTCVESPKTFIRRMGYIESACEEIAMWWDKV